MVPFKTKKNDMEAAQGGRRQRRVTKRASTKKLRTPRGWRDNWVLPPLRSPAENIWVDVDEEPMEIQSRGHISARLVPKQPAEQLLPTLEDLPMLSNTTLQNAVYAGIDYHKKTISVTFGDRDGNILEQPTIQNHRQLVEPFFEQFQKLECVVESCRGYEWLVDVLREQGHTVHVGHSRAIKLIAKSNCKTDKIDSRILMQLLAKSFLPTTYIPTADERKYRELLRHRSSLVRTATRSKLRIHAILAKENIHIRFPFSTRGRMQLQQLCDELKLPAHRQRILEQELSVLDFAEERADEQMSQITRHSRKEPGVLLLRTIPGFNTLMAMAYIGEVGDVSRFKKGDQVAAYLGLVPRVYSSGSTARCGRITKTGSPFMRWMLVQAAWSAIKGSPNLRFRFASIAKRRGQKVAIVAIARKLAIIAFKVLREKTEYKEEMLDAGLARAAF